MKKILLILIAAAFTVQSNHLVGLFAHVRCSYEVCDAEQPEVQDKEIKDDKKENDKQSLSSLDFTFRVVPANPPFILLPSLLPSKPHLRRLSPPPDAC